MSGADDDSTLCRNRVRAYLSAVQQSQVSDEHIDNALESIRHSSNVHGWWAEPQLAAQIAGLHGYRCEPALLVPGDASVLTAMSLRSRLRLGSTVIRASTRRKARREWPQIANTVMASRVSLARDC